MSLEYSHGGRASVFLLPSDSPFAEIADVVRREPTGDPFWYERLFFMHKFASRLYPDHFIQATAIACTHHPKASAVARYLTHLYSKLAPTPPEHAVYAAHFSTFTKPSDTFWQTADQPTPCDCSVCLHHEQLHQDYYLYQQARFLNSRIFRQSGLLTPFNDRSDYCLGPNGIIFFEIETFNAAVITAKNNSSNHPDKDYLDWMLRKYMKSFIESARYSPSGHLRISF